MPNKVSRTEQLRLARLFLREKGVNQEGWGEPFTGRASGANYTKIKPFFTCFRFARGQYFSNQVKNRRRDKNLCVQQSFLSPRKGCWPPSATPFWRTPDTGSYQCPRLKQHSKSCGPATFARL